MSTLEEITREALPKPERGEFAWENFTEDYRQGLQLFALQVMRGFVERVRLRAASPITALTWRCFDEIP